MISVHEAEKLSLKQVEKFLLAAKVGESPNGETFVWMRTYCEAVQAETNAAALVELSDRITQKNVEKKR